MIITEILIALCVLANGSPTAPEAVESPVELVDPFIGTGGHGHTFPGATVPFGMVQLSPDTRLTGWDGCSGYHYSDSIVYGFSHTHLSGTGVSDYGDILFMPAVGPIQLDNGHRGELAPPEPEKGYASRFRKETEHAAPGYYAVHLDEPNIDVELTATARTGFHRYLFPESEESHIVVDLAHRDTVINSELRIVTDQEIEGMRSSDAWARDQRLYFVARFSRPFSEHGFEWGDTINTEVLQHSGENVVAYFRFPTAANEEILVQVGISSVDIAGARKNLEAEWQPWDFEAARKRASAEWERQLSKIVVEGGTLEQRRTFYTALYHTAIAPNLFSDVDGRVRGMDGELHKVDHDAYTVFSLWDTFRAAHPLFTLIDRKRTTDFMKTFLHQFQTGGKLPIWELAGNYTGCMIGYHSIPVIADAYLKGIRDYDATALLEAMMVSAEDDVLGLDAYKELGYIPSDHESEAVSKTLEYGYDDWCIARMAEALGKPEVAAKFDQRSQAYKHLFDASTGFIKPRRNGGFIENFDPREVTFNYTEANGWQYTLFAPHDLAGLTALLGGDAELIKKLDSMFEASTSTTGRNQADITGLIGQYAHGNEPSHHVAYLYNYAGQPWKTQKRVHQILTTLYQDQPDGLSGNEDCGQMSAWYVLSALGFYPVCPGSNEYVIGTPLFDRATINFENGKSFSIETERNGPDDIYIQAAQLAGDDYELGYLTHDTLTAGGSLQVSLGGSPNKTWATLPEHRPNSSLEAKSILSVPNIVSDSRVFRDSVEATIEHSNPALALHYTLDGSAPSEASARFEGPLTFTDSAELRAIAIAPNGTQSIAAFAKFKHIDHNWTIAIDTPYSPQYTGGGDTALIDGLRGTHEFRVGSWQGWFGKDMQVTIDLGEATVVRQVTGSFLQDTRSWIWMPTELEIQISSDGKVFEQVSVLKHTIPLDDDTPNLLRLAAPLPENETRFVRVIAKKLDVIPDWHLGRGNPAWIFADEITIK